jgi:hypothetical protein
LSKFPIKKSYNFYRKLEHLETLLCSIRTEWEDNVNAQQMSRAYQLKEIETFEKIHFNFGLSLPELMDNLLIYLNFWQFNDVLIGFLIKPLDI